MNQTDNCEFYLVFYNFLIDNPCEMFIRSVQGIISDFTFNPKAHVELVIKKSKNKIYCYGINNGEPCVHRYVNKTFDNPNYNEYDVLAFKTNEITLNNIIDNLNEKIKNQEGFDSNFKFNFIPIIKNYRISPINKWFCSSLITNVLIECKVLNKKDFNCEFHHVSPQKLYDVCISKGAIELRKNTLLIK